MFIITLRFAEKSKAPALMEAHREWITRGFDRGIFLLVGTLQPAAGGTLIAHNISREGIKSFVAEDPFVAEGVVTAEILEVAANRTDERLAFLQA